MVYPHKTIVLSVLIMQFFAFSLGVQPIKAQMPFTCRGQIYTLSNTSQEFNELTIDPNNNAVRLSPFQNGKMLQWEVLGIRSTDNLLYGMDSEQHILYRMDAQGSIEELGMVDLEPNLDYLAGDVSPDGNFLVVIGSSNEQDERITKIDLRTNTYSTSSILLTGSRHFVDFSFDPISGIAYGYDIKARKIVSINLTTAALKSLLPIGVNNEIEGLFFDAFGKLFAYGSTANGEASALFSIRKTTGEESTITTGPASIHKVTEIASCPYTVGLQHSLNPKIAFPCDELTYTFWIANQSRLPTSGIDFEFELPDGLLLKQILYNPYMGSVNANLGSRNIQIENMLIPKGIDSIELQVEVSNTPAGIYNSQAILINLPPQLGEARVSDNPRTARRDDPSPLEVKQIGEEDSLFQNHFFCIGETIELDASPYGSSLLWEDGSKASVKPVSEEGTYTVVSQNKCHSLAVVFDVTAASCPFTIALAYDIIPKETLPCSEVIYRFIFENDAGLELNGVDLEETLPNGFTFLELLRDPLGGNLEEELLVKGILKISDMSLPIGFDTLDILVEVGNIPPGIYQQRATLEGFPQKIGPRRFSYDPKVPGSDSTAIKILGVEKDSLQIELELCEGSSLTLDGRPYGVDFLWFNGSKSEQVSINKTGLYELIVFNGCDPRYIFFSVVEADPIALNFVESSLSLRLGDSLHLKPIIQNEGDTIFYKWQDPHDSSLSCLNCPTPFAKPVRNIIYKLQVSNAVCTDSMQLEVMVDNTRRIYAPNIFSPNQDGINDYFFLQSPDFGIIESLTIFNRWGNIIFHSEKTGMNYMNSGWDGKYKGQFVGSGVYLWRAKITFLDELTEVFSGDIAIIR